MKRKKKDWQSVRRYLYVNIKTIRYASSNLQEREAVFGVNESLSLQFIFFSSN